jgi:dihydroxyacid dehydratase/phosphogluconate dehydratase
MHISGTAWRTSSAACFRPQASRSGCRPLALLRTGDTVRIDVPNRHLDMLVDGTELAKRRAAWTTPEDRFERGYGWMFAKHVSQADKGCDFDYLTPGFGKTAASLTFIEGAS